MPQLKQIQSHMTTTGLVADIFPVSRLLSFCALSDFGDINYAYIIFSHIINPNVYIWNTMIRGYCKFKQWDVSFWVFRRMIQECVEMDERSYVFALKASEGFKCSLVGEEVHCRICKMGFGSELLVVNGLVHFYVRHGFLSLGRVLFDECSVRDVVSWTTMIDGYTKGDLPDVGLKLFYTMLDNGGMPNEVTMITVVSACSLMRDLSLGTSIFGYILKNNVDLTLNLLNALVDMYIKCGCVTSAKKVFETMETLDVYTWTSMINGYAKQGELELAKMIFDEMPERNVVSWNAMIAGYSQKDKPKEALEIFREMEKKNVRPVEGTLVCVLSACAQLGCLDIGRQIYHYYVDQKRVGPSVILMNAFIDLCAKCGNIDEALEHFEEMPERDLVSWNIMIIGFAVHGYAKLALNLFKKMKILGFVLDDITFVGVLSACNHGGLVIEGREYFKNMKKVFNIEPKSEHYSCMIDLLGRVGNLEEAYDLIKRMPMEPDEAAWGALLNACRMHGNVELGQIASMKLLDLDPADSGTYLVLANMYSSKRRLDDVRMVRSMMRSRGVKKTPGHSSIEVDAKSYEFLAADISHPQSKEIYQVLDDILEMLTLEGYVPRVAIDEFN
ncbi:hypothetical protein GIB67_008379 [Kingdonia uniflora]|uniref:Pentatricopeptide repeat-containing protein n=1 Tax=Kingdonia uniflora TaxID=39325 RepID=A0A7J7N5G1_9MAGN|nr:hypothetical protein GIB67_008379 [Kingdonia uniflora]